MDWFKLKENKIMTDQYKEVDERFDKKFILNPTSNWTAVSNKDVKSFLHSELEKVRQEAEDNMRKRCVEALPKKREHTNRCGSLEDVGEVGYCTCGTDDFNSAIDQATQNINNLDKE